ncbi:hypothetical protein BSFA1_62800 (plasmid) [Burkholderia sp. SFA1]|uniref:DUF2235 domain-containing protein n=1 Tax=unclassified Caballeronia TaxID=2646786 RepID=UPI001F2379F9|nr:MULTISPECIES: DUF2235 domain-containing protein [unclassified Caballeronia]MCE4545801.1 DUF2235 domain-containing protein [Caballeronia sp. PC1]MCE4572077.1 DUF2235 domain-containing protein [Caballeronia sp. CLC5]BBQ01152.1 hypothetical protein BSFA1_62800 [Burkholderia sp. SFA1]
MKRIVLLSDGTGNSSAKAQKTNVWRLFQALDQTAPGQYVMYDDGVGTSSNKYLALLGGAFGWGLKRNVIDLYEFVCRNYSPGDTEISGFGFSRGAFTIRVLVGFITHEGLVRFRSDEELHRYARAAYRHYRSERLKSSVLVKAARGVRDLALAAITKIRGLESYEKVRSTNIRGGDGEQIPIRFLGLWDTVSAYGVPIKELKKAISKAFWPMEFHELSLSSNVQRACHALSLDDERATFHPVLWDEKHEALNDGRITQVWFAGVHSNVGGGYPEDRLSYVSLHWILSQAHDAGLAFIRAEIDKIARMKSPYARLYDSRARFGMFYRYRPRAIPECTRADSNGKRHPILPIVDESVILRMAFGGDQHIPIPLNGDFCVLTADGKLKPFKHGLQYTKADYDLPPCHCAPLLGGEKTADDNTKYTLDEAMDALDHPAKEAVDLVQNTVWWRQVFYLVTLFFTVLLVCFPLIGAWLSHRLDTYERSSDVTRRGVHWLEDTLDTVLVALKNLLPAVSTPWTRAFGAHLDAFALVSVGLLISILVGRVLRTRVSDRVRIAWQERGWPQYMAVRARSESAGLRATIVAAGAAWLLAAISFAARHFELSIWPIALVALVLTILAMLRSRRVTQLQTIVSDLKNTQEALARHNNSNAPRGAYIEILKGNKAASLSLCIAQKLRMTPWLCKGYDRLRKDVIPWGFVVILCLAALFVVNRAIFDSLNSIGFVCDEKIKADAAPFSTDETCWNSGIRLERDARYEVVIETQEPWFDLAGIADVGGFGSHGIAQYAFYFLKRYWFEDWFKPIVKIGSMGRDEYVLEPVAPMRERKVPTIKYDGPSLEKIPDKMANSLASEHRVPDDRNAIRAQFTARTSGPMYLFVNDAVIPWPKSPFYRNNRGTANVTVYRLLPDGSSVQVPPNDGK